MSTIREMTAQVVEWIDPLIPNDQRDPMNTCIKMTEEVSELMHAIHTGNSVKDIGGECADVLILLLDVAFLNNVDLEQAFHNKMNTNMLRTWKEKNGSLKHETDR